MRLVHLADLHLGFRQYHRLTPTGINQREADVGNAFRAVIEAVIAERPDVVLIAGDVFHSVRPMNPAIIHAFQQFSRLRQELPETITVLIAGNHDRPRATETGCILRLFSQLGIHVVDAEPRRLVFPERELAILAVPDGDAGYPALLPEPGFRYNVLVLHGEVEGMLPRYLAQADRTPMEIPLEAIGASRWSYVALGHYHVFREIAPNACYSGSIDYTSTNPWGELVEERQTGLPGKGFVEFDLATGERHFHHIQPQRHLLDLPSIAARGMTASELDSAIRAAVEGCEGGIDDKIVRLVARDVPRHIARDLDHKTLREYKRRALHFQLDARRPEVLSRSVSGAPGRRPTLQEVVASYLARRPLDADVDREALVNLGRQYLHEADVAVAASGAAAATATPSPSA